LGIKQQQAKGVRHTLKRPLIDERVINACFIIPIDIIQIENFVLFFHEKQFQKKIWICNGDFEASS
jgi:hypothetical protein